MSKKNKHLVAKLGRAQGLLECIEALPEFKGCTTNIRKVRKIVQSAVLDLAGSGESSLTANTAVRNIRFAAELLYALLRIGNLKDYFNFYTQHAYTYEHCFQKG